MDEGKAIAEALLGVFLVFLGMLPLHAAYTKNRTLLQILTLGHSDIALKEGGRPILIVLYVLGIILILAGLGFIGLEQITLVEHTSP